LKKTLTYRGRSQNEELTKKSNPSQVLQIARWWANRKINVGCLKGGGFLWGGGKLKKDVHANPQLGGGGGRAW